MGKCRKILTLCMAVLMVMQVVLPTVSQAVNLNIQFERPYTDDNGDGTVGNDIYTLVRQAIQTVFKIGEQDENGNLSFNSAYYCLRGGLGFGSTDEILTSGVDYTKLTDLSNKEAVVAYFTDTIGYAITDEEYNAICWVVDNMYLPKSEHADEMKQDLLNNAGITSSQLTDDDIEVVQQIALWYFTNYDENGGANSVSLADSVALANLLQINNTQPNNDTTVSYNKNRAEQINTLYRYFVDNAKANASGVVAKVPEKLELDKTLEPKIEATTVPGTSLNAYVVGPFKINETQKGNIDYTFSYTLKYKTSSVQTEWSTLEIDNTMGTVFLSDENGTVLDRTKNVKDMIAGEEFYVTMLSDVLGIATITEFGLDIAYDSYYYNTTSEILVADADDQPVLKLEKEKITNPGADNVTVKPEEKVFDLALRKFITKTNEDDITERIPKIYLEDLRNGTDTEAVFEHSKEPIYLKRGNTIVYTIRIYNQGDLAGYATEVTDYLCDSLELVPDSQINEQYGWVTEDGKTLKTNYLANTLIKAYDTNLTSDEIGRDEKWQQAEDGTDGLYYADLQVECRIKDTADVGITLPNIAEISEDLSEGTVDVADRDSEPDNLTQDDVRNYEGNPWHEDDDDYERVIIEPDKVFDLALRKYISNIERNGETVEFASRVPQIDTTPLRENRSTAIYTHPKNVLTVKQGDIITYKLRVYNEGELDGYASEITDYIPEGLGLLVGYSGNDNWLIDTADVNNQPLVGENGLYKNLEDVPTNGIFKDEDLSEITVVTAKGAKLEIRDYISLRDELIKKYGAEALDGDLYQVSTSNQNDGLFYQEIEVTCVVVAPNTYEGILTNIAEISVDKAVEIDANGVETEVDVADRDSTPDNVDLTNYELREENSTYQQDDDDYEPVQLKYFDLALRKFITGVNEAVVDTRIPEFYIDEEGNYRYRHDKTPVEVVDRDEVTYTIRVFNEGTIEGFAEEIEDDIPEGLIFLPENETNIEHRWKMYYYNEEGVLVETENEEEAEVIRTDFLSEANGTIDETTGKNSNLLEVFDKETMESPDYRDIKVVFKVAQEDIPEDNTDGIIINKAHITDDSDDDEDSIPDEWNEGEDDQDKEYIYVQKFDLALFKWVSQSIVTVDGKTTTTETGFKPNIGKTEATGDGYRDNNEEEPIASVTIDKKKLNSTVVKFVYNIKVVNEGDIAGYATEVTDYIPEGLRFVAEDNPLWTEAEGGKITTRALETKLLNPGESAEVQVTFTWINGENNLGLKTNIAAITEDYNEKGIPDEDSDPGNEDIPNYEKEQEDDDDFALVILTLKTGKGITYIWLITLTITIIAAGAMLIKKYVL